jgi:hypothetical protein
MFQLPLVEAQILLIGLGILFQFMAISAKRRERSVYPQGHDEVEEKVDEPQVKNAVPKPARRSPAPRPTTRDYYDMENPEPGVRPGELLRTAKVSYFNDVNVKPPPKA